MNGKQTTERNWYWKPSSKYPQKKRAKAWMFCTNKELCMFEIHLPLSKCYEVLKYSTVHKL